MQYKVIINYAMIFLSAQSYPFNLCMTDNIEFIRLW